MKDFGLKKLYYSISEVSKLTDLEQYILRYWETEFDQLKPSKNRAGNRIYTNKDIKLIIRIKKLLRDEKYTIEGAKKILEEVGTKTKPETKSTVKIAESELKSESSKVIELKEEVRSLKADLEEVKGFLLDLYSKF